MIQKMITCPKCGKSIRVNIPENTTGTASVNCPQCNTKLRFEINKKPIRLGADEPTEITEHHVFDIPSANAIPSLYILKQEFALKKGRNVVGRRPESSDNNVTLSPADPYMSRQNACIEVKIGLHGMEYCLEAIKSTNPMKLNGQELGEGDVVFLKLGDHITMGRTDVLFQVAHYYDDETLKPLK